MKTCKFVHYEIDSRDYTAEEEKAPSWSGYAAKV
jgi:hypothetical protein